MLAFLSNSTLIFWGSITLMATVPVIMHYWARVRKAEIEAALKQDMIRRGMSAEEIVRVLEARSRKRPDEEEEESEKKEGPPAPNPFRKPSERVWTSE